MATLTLNNVPDEIVKALERAAKAHAVSPADEAVEWLERAVVVEDRLTTMQILDNIRRTREKLTAAGVWLSEEAVQEGLRHRYE